MAPATTFVPVEEYLRSSFEPGAAYVDGPIEERAGGENDRSAWQDAILAWFRPRAKQGRIRVRPELRVQVATATFLAPDVTLLDRNLPIEQIVTHPLLKKAARPPTPGGESARIVVGEVHHGDGGSLG